MSTKTASTSKTNGIEQAFARTPWLQSALVVGLGGAVLMILNLVVLHYALDYYEGGSLIDTQAKDSLFGPAIIIILGLFLGPALRQMQNPTEGGKLDMTVALLLLFVLSFIFLGLPVPASNVAFCATLGGTSMVAYHLLYFFSKFPSVRMTVLGVWFFAYITVWLVGLQMPINLPLFILIWTAIGFGGGLFVYTNAEDKIQSAADRSFSARKDMLNAQSHAQGVAQTRRRASRTSGVVSRYGRIPQDTVDLLTNHIRRITGPIIAALPIGASVTRRNQTVQILLDTVITDWRENDNFDLMSAEDIDDFQSFIEAASYLSDSETTEIDVAIYKVTLRAFAQDWLANWNEAGNSGPPDRIY